MAMVVHDAVKAGSVVAFNAKHMVQGKPRPLPLISVNESQSLTLHRDNLEEVMKHVDPGIPVAIISVVGAFRSGKSFLLSWFVRVLSGRHTRGGGRVGGANGRSDGFSWAGGHQPHTQGMTVWSQPFIREVDHGEGGRTKMAVLLVDTQGTFDHKMKLKLEACMFGLSTTLSSCQIFNVKNQVQVDTLGSLAAYLELGTVADGDHSGGEQVHEAPFQRLEVLIRDWQNWEEWNDPVVKRLETLHDQFNDYLKGILVDNDHNNSETEKINGCFRDRIGCFGLPHPGDMVTSWSRFDGDVNQIGPGFSRMMPYFIETVILGKLRPTRLPNRSEGQFVKAVGGWVKLFNDALSNGNLPEAMSWLGKMYESDNNTSVDEAFDKFQRDVREQSKMYVRQVELNQLVDRLKRKAMNSLKLKGTEGAKTKARIALRRKLDGEGNRLERSNRNRATRTAIATEIMVELMKFCIGRGSKRNLRFLLGST